ncbi:MAG: hypothetical protein AB7O57_08335 [Hyphomicrobiaceae bacterium]
MPMMRNFASPPRLPVSKRAGKLHFVIQRRTAIPGGQIIHGTFVKRGKRWRNEGVQAAARRRRQMDAIAEKRRLRTANPHLSGATIRELARAA